MTARTLRARWVLPIDAPPIEGGYVAISDGMIAEVGADDPDRGPVTDLGDVVLLPGLVNAHTHLEFSGLAKPLGRPGMSLPAWIRTVIADRGRGDRRPEEAIAAGLRESAAAGATTIGEIATSPAAFYQGRAGARMVQFQEAIGFSAGRVDSVAAEMERRVAAAGAAAGISPHAPYTVHPDLLQKLVAIASARRLPVAMHLAESIEELQLLRDGAGPFRELLEDRSMWDGDAIPRGSRPLDYLRQLAEAPRALAIHGNYFDSDEIAFVAARRERLSVVYCPRTHAYFQHPPYPLPAMLRAGVRVVLGTDSRASNPDLNLLGEIQFAAARFPKLDSAVLVRMATLDAAEALGLGQAAGSLAPGKRADLAMVRCDSACRAPYEALIAPDARATLIAT